MKDLFSKENFRTLIISASAMCFAVATMDVPMIFLFGLLPIVLGGFAWLVGKCESSKAVALPTWWKFYLFLLDITAFYYFYNAFPRLYPSLADVGKFSLIASVIAVGGLPFAHWATRWLIVCALPPVQNFFRRFTKMEAFLASGLFLVLVGILLFCSQKSSVWIAPTNPDFYVVDDPWNQENIYMNTVFGCDCRTYTSIREGCWLNIFRHPYYYYAFFPFLPILFLTAFLLWLSGFGVWYYSVAAAWAILQIFWWILGGIMLRRLLLEVLDGACSYAVMMFYLVSFPMIFVFVPERLILTSFTLLAFLYFRKFTENRDLSRFTPWDYVTAFAATGTTLTSVLMPVFSLWQNRKTVKDFGRELTKFSIIGIMVTLFLAPYTFNLSYGLSECFKWTSATKTTQNAKEFQDKQFFQFMESNLFVPDYRITSRGIGSVGTSEIRNRFTYTGMTVCALCFLAWGMYRKIPFVQEMTVWILLAVALLGILGFGAVYNEMTLYVTYFSWAILPMTILPFYKLFGNRYSQMTVTVGVLALFSFIVQLNIIWQVTTQTNFIIP